MQSSMDSLLPIGRRKRFLGPSCRTRLELFLAAMLGIVVLAGCKPSTAQHSEAKAAAKMPAPPVPPAAPAPPAAPMKPAAPRAEKKPLEPPASSENQSPERKDFYTLPTAEEGPYFLASIVYEGGSEGFYPLSRYGGRTNDGKSISNMSGTPMRFNPSLGYSATLSFKPRITSVWNSPEGVRSKHTKLSPGMYLFSVGLKDSPYFVWKWMEIEAHSQVNHTFTLQPSQGGSLEVTAPAVMNRVHVFYLPLDDEGRLPLKLEPAERRRRSAVAEFGRRALGFYTPKFSDGKVVVSPLHPGEYLVFAEEDFVDKNLFKLQWCEGRVKIEPGKTSQLTLELAPPNLRCCRFDGQPDI